jgi:hypothetical protein
MIEQNPYLPKQMNGAIVNSVMNALDNELVEADNIIDYLYSLSIETAQETELENIGRIIGYPRPLVPEGFEQENLFIFVNLPMTPDETIGFSELETEIGGQLSSLESSQTNYMSLGMYRKFLDKIAYIKRYGITLYSVDMIAKLISDNYTLSYDENKDIVITFEQSIGYKNVWILSNLFYRLATAPQVIIKSADNIVDDEDE